MKKFILFSFLFISMYTLQAQSRDFDGIWTGTLTTNDDRTMSVTLYIDDNNVYSVTTDSDGDRIKDTDYEVIWSKGYGEQLNYVWMNKGGVWTETQSYFMAYINSTKLSVYFTRHVSNESEDYDGNTDWGYTATGYLYKE
ncbi:hypothetical protein [Neptunitalea lumnitzerae]|uniref:Uncharacterized protein n=1 Tax=Neptunitalea lumnitzerae TaxID=2965509 RepID=A0ABQ5MEQ7_9FLAO|nr:hypothetical protein [Neptunitalea sp. Y10]GLB47880.1 hypothetical protein Y10_02480 [Neptunitalea sp. Y10]